MFLIIFWYLVCFIRCDNSISCWLCLIPWEERWTSSDWNQLGVSFVIFRYYLCNFILRHSFIIVASGVLCVFKVIRKLQLDFCSDDRVCVKWIVINMMAWPLLQENFRRYSKLQNPINTFYVFIGFCDILYLLQFSCYIF